VQLYIKMEEKTFAVFNNCRLYLIVHKPMHIVTLKIILLNLDYWCLFMTKELITVYFICI